MELKTARLTLLIDPNKKAAFERLCATQDRTPSQVVRQFIREYLAQHGVQYLASGLSAPDGEPVDTRLHRKSSTKRARVTTPQAVTPRAPRRGKA